MYLALFSGLRPSPANWGIMSTLLMQFIAAHTPRSCYTEGPESYVAYQYVDDGAFAEPWIGMRPWQAVSLWQYGLARCLGPPVAHLKKKQLEGNAETCLGLWAINVSTVLQTFTLPQEKIARDKVFLMPYEFGPCIARIPLGKLQELRGRAERWSNCNSAHGAEMRFIDKMLVSRSGASYPKESKRGIKIFFIDFRTIVETIRAHMATGEYWGQSYTTDFIGALSLDEQLSFPDDRGRLIWIGYDATLTQCSAVDYTHMGGDGF